MPSNIISARWWLAYPAALLMLAIADAGLGFWHPFPGRLPEQFSSAYLRLYLNDAPRDKPIVAFFGDSVIWGYKIRVQENAVSVLQRAIPKAEMLNLAYEGGSPPNSAILLRYVLRSHLRLSGIVIGVNVKEFSSLDSAYRTLHPSLERLSQPFLTPTDFRTLSAHLGTDLNARLGASVETVWRLYRLRTDLRERLFGTDDMGGALANLVQRATGTAAAKQRAHRPTADDFLGAYDVTPIDSSNVGMQYYQDFLRDVCRARIPTVAFLTPTNHRLLHEYIDTPEYRANLRRLAVAPHCNNVVILNLDTAVPYAHFIDNDHLDQIGQRVLAARLKPYIRRMLP